MTRLVFEVRVVDDCAMIQEFIAQDSPQNADRFLLRLEDQFRKIAQTPLMGRVRAELAVGVRSIAFGRYVIFYKASAEEVLILAVLHGARDLKPALTEE